MINSIRTPGSLGIEKPNFSPGSTVNRFFTPVPDAQPKVDYNSTFMRTCKLKMPKGNTGHIEGKRPASALEE
jgi:hypothetical protein